jgi:arylsulfatase A-like enzyme
MIDRMFRHDAFALAAALSLAAASLEVGLVAWAYRDLPMPDRARFLLFYAASLAAAMTVTLGVVSSVVGSFARSRRSLGLGFGTALGMLIVLAARWHMTVRTADFDPFGGPYLAGFGIAVIGAAAAGGAAGWLARSGWAQSRGGSWLALACALLALGAFSTRQAAQSSPTAAAPVPRNPVESPLSSRSTNLLLVSIDTLRADHLETYGYPRATAPTVARLAREGIVVEWAMTQGSFTAPSIATLLTGTYPPTHHVLNNGDYLQDFNTTLAEHLAKHGYETAAFVANPYLDSAFNLGQGFQLYESKPAKPETIDEENVREARLPVADAERVLSVIERRPFFLWLHYLGPHNPYLLPAAYRDLFRADEPSNESSEQAERDLDWLWGEMASRVELYEKRELRLVVSQYDGLIRFNDDHFGEIFGELERNGLLEDTLVVVVSDHGESLGEHSHVGHGPDVYDDTARVPLVFHHPALRAGERVRSLHSVVDVTPTILDVLGLPEIPGGEGESFAPRLLGTAADPSRRHHFLMGGVRPGYKTLGVRTETHKLVWKVDRRLLPVDALLERLTRLWVPDGVQYPFQCRRIERALYDLAADPGETRNVAESQPEVAQQLDAELWAWIRSTYGPSGSRAVRRGEVSEEVEEHLRALGYAE